MHSRPVRVSICVLVALITALLTTPTRADTFSEDILNADPRNDGVQFSIIQSWRNDDIALNVEAISYDKSMSDVQRILFMSLERTADLKYDRFVLSYKRNPKFFIDGQRAREIGKEYSWQNPIALIRELLPEIRTMEGEQAYPRLNFSLLGGTMEAIDNLHRFHRDWYLDAALTEE